MPAVQICNFVREKIQTVRCWLKRLSNTKPVSKMVNMNTFKVNRSNTESTTYISDVDSQYMSDESLHGSDSEQDVAMDEPCPDMSGAFYNPSALCNHREIDVDIMDLSDFIYDSPEFSIEKPLAERTSWGSTRCESDVCPEDFESDDESMCSDDDDDLLDRYNSDFESVSNEVDTDELMMEQYYEQERVEAACPKKSEVGIFIYDFDDVNYKFNACNKYEYCCVKKQKTLLETYDSFEVSQQQFESLNSAE